jgi:hypothetical protein
MKPLSGAFLNWRQTDFALLSEGQNVCENIADSFLKLFELEVLHVPILAVIFPRLLMKVH